MDWLDRLNRTETRYDLGGAHAEILYWAHNSELPDNMPHRHTYFEVCQVGAHGAGLFRVRGQDHPLRPGDVFVARPGVIHQIVNTARPCMELYWVSYQIASAGGHPLHGVLRAFTESPVALIPDDTGCVAGAWRAVRELAPGAGEESLRCLVAAFLLTVAEAFSLVPPPGVLPAPRTIDRPQPATAARPGHPADRSPSGARPSEPRLATVRPGSSGTTLSLDPTLRLSPLAQSPVPPGRPARDTAARFALRYIHDNLDSPLGADEVARQTGVSRRHLSRLIRAYAGTSFHEYILWTRLHLAAHLLRRSDLAVKVIGAQVGYPDVHHFTRVFSRHIGCPPAAYRKGYGGGGPVPNVQTTGMLV